MKTSKWDALLVQELSLCNRRAPAHFGVPVTEEEVDITANTKIIDAGHVSVPTPSKLLRCPVHTTFEGVGDSTRD
jgi:hypothetical protein